MGLVNEVVAPEHLLDRTLKYAAELATYASPTSMAVMNLLARGAKRSAAASSSEGVRALVQPGGSIRDNEVVVVADAAGAAMFMTGTRHFRH